MKITNRSKWLVIFIKIHVLCNLSVTITYPTICQRAPMDRNDTHGLRGVSIGCQGLRAHIKPQLVSSVRPGKKWRSSHFAWQSRLEWALRVVNWIKLSHEDQNGFSGLDVHSYWVIIINDCMKISLMSLSNNHKW